MPLISLDRDTRFSWALKTPLLSLPVSIVSLIKTVFVSSFLFFHSQFNSGKAAEREIRSSQQTIHDAGHDDLGEVASQQLRKP